jgi:hypothetical protein
MPPSATATIRQETVNRLSELPAFRRVYDARMPQLRRDMLPAVRVYTSATAAGLSISIPEFRTTTTLIVQIIAEDITDAATALKIDELCEAAKVRLLCDGKWLQLFERVLSIDTEVDRNIEGEWRNSVATMTFSLQCTEAYEPEIPDWLDKISLRRATNGRGFGVDVIDPAADPNTGPPGTPPNVEPQPPGYPGGHPGPDGRIEVEAEFVMPPREPEPEEP